MGMGVHQNLVASPMYPGIVPDHPEQLRSLLHPFVLCRIQMHLPHMQRLIAAVNVSGCPVVKPHSGFQAGQVGNPPASCRVTLPEAMVAAALVQEQGVLSTETALLYGNAESLKHIGGNFHFVHPLHDPFKHTRLQDDFRVLAVDLFRKLPGQAEMFPVIHGHKPDARRPSKKLHPQFPNHT